MIAFIFFGGTTDKALREYNANDLGFNGAKPDAIVECHQRYFHIWFLPFFPLGKFWIMKDGSDWYPLSREEIQRVEGLAEIPPTPLYMWTGVVVIPLLIVLFLMIQRNIPG